jgi:hypothetical protein
VETVYIESTIPSYLTAHRSTQEPMSSHQQLTQEWWEEFRPRYRMYSSIAVRLEVSKGDALAAKRRLEVMDGIPELELTSAIEPMANGIVKILQLPTKAAMDATHLAFCIVHRMDYLLTWNCTHLANATLQKTLFEYCSYNRLHMPVICTPELLTPPTL